MPDTFEVYKPLDPVNLKIVHWKILDFHLRQVMLKMIGLEHAYRHTYGKGNVPEFLQSRLALVQDIRDTTHNEIKTLNKQERL